jgi:hypothetical protein
MNFKIFTSLFNKITSITYIKYMKQYCIYMPVDVTATFGHLQRGGTKRFALFIAVRKYMWYVLVWLIFILRSCHIRSLNLGRCTMRSTPSQKMEFVGAFS